MKNTFKLLAIFSLLFSVASADESEFRTPIIDLGIVVSDLDTSMKFYTEAIGFTSTGEFTATKELTKESGLSAGEKLVIKRLSLGKDEKGTTIKLMQSAEEKSKKSDQTYITSSLGFSYLTIHVKSTKVALERLKKAGIKVLAKGPAIIPGGKVALTVVKDPDGNFVELVGPADHE